VSLSASGTLFLIREATTDDRPWLIQALDQALGSPTQVSRGRMIHLDAHPAFVAEIGGERLGFITYLLDGDECEISGLASFRENQGVGTALIEAALGAAGRAGCRRACLVTTNDNTRSIRFYQRRGFRIAAVRVGRIDDYRASLKPEIALTGNDGIPIRDEIELEVRLPSS
jgi:ribosomal protein S18 acetylase RimI-like enzyme